MSRKAVILAAFLALLALLPLRTVAAQSPQVKVLFFYSPTCPHCEYVIQNVMPGIAQKYGNRLVVAYIDITDPSNYQNLLLLEKEFKVDSSKSGVPEVFIGEYVLIGQYEVADRLDGLIQQYLDKGGVGFPGDVVIQNPNTGTPQPSGQPTAIQTTRPTAQSTGATATPKGTAPPAPTATPAAGAKTVNIAYFYKTGCQECARLTYDLNFIHSRYPNMVVTEFEVVEQAPLYEWIAQRLNVPENRRLIAPALFIGDSYLIGDDISIDKIQSILDRYGATGAPAFWDSFNPNDTSATTGILDRFKSFGALTVAGAGLIDGLNPCAFATMVFLISYLAFVGRKSRDILFVGGAFALGVFATYMLVGLGLLQAVKWLGQMTALAKWVYILAGALCVAAAVLSIRDYLKARSGKPEEMSLKLPTPWRKQINKVIREGSRLPAFVAVALVTGLVVSLIELACTGQIYLPTILYVMSVPALKARATSYLLLYNLLFIVPLIIVFVLAYLGTTSERLGQWINRRTSTVKLLTAVVFIGLAGWLLYSVL